MSIDWQGLLSKIIMEKNEKTEKFRVLEKKIFLIKRY